MYSLYALDFAKVGHVSAMGIMSHVYNQKSMVLRISGIPHTDG